MPAIIDETALTAEEGAEVSVPVGADTRTAASLLPAWTALIKRIMWLENFYDAAKALVLGGTITPAAGVALDLSAGDVTIDGGDLQCGTGYMKANGRFKNQLFTAGESGRANRKALLSTPAAGATTLVDPRNYDTYWIVPAGAGCIFKIDPATDGNLVEGDHVTFIADGGSDYVEITDSSDVSQGTIKAANGFYRERTLVWIGGVWKQLRVPYAL